MKGFPQFAKRPVAKRRPRNPDDQDGREKPGSSVAARRRLVEARRAGFTAGSVGRHLVRLGSFMTLGMLSMNVARLAEAAYLGVVGTEALAALGFAFPITIFMFAFAGGLGAGASSVIARVYGAGDRRQAARLVTHAQILVLAVGVAIGALGIAFAEMALTALGADGDVLVMATEYTAVYMLGFPLFMLSMVGSTLLRATGVAASPGVVMTTGSVLQIALGPVFIFGWFGCPEMGISGAAWAHVASRVLSVGLYLAVLARVRMWNWSLEGLGASWAAILHVGGPATLSNLVHPISLLTATALLAVHGHEVVAGYSVAARVEMMVHMVLWSASASIPPFVGQNWGAGNYQRVRVALRLCNWFCLAWGLVTFLVLAVVGGTVVRWIDPNPTVVEVAALFFLIIPLSIGFMGVMQVSTSCFNALGRPMPPMLISLARTFACYIPLIFLGNHLWGYAGVFAATAATNVLMGVAAWYWNRQAVRRGIAAAGEAARAAG